MDFYTQKSGEKEIMTGNIEKFSFSGNDVRSYKDGFEQVWFVAKDVCSALGYENTSNALRGLDYDEKGALILPTLGGEQENLTINESGLYSLILKSRKPEAKRFKKWVTSEVLPSIRKTGAYASAQNTYSNTLDEAQKIFNSCKSLAEIFGLKENSALISASNATFSVTGVDIPKLIGVTHLLASSQDRAKTPTELGKKIGLSAQKFNRLLETLGYQVKNEKVWEATDKGKAFSVLYDTGKKHKSGRPVQQLMWLENILDEINFDEAA